ncbi:MAG: hypothetical protein J2P43_02605 [Candidatus Dormibacteraeota bacterium]|nr:hypothetical protein [Candidatus Dormibacteraeota bacterium]
MPLSLGALHGWFDFEDAWDGSRPLVAAHFEERGRSFSRMVRREGDSPAAAHGP